MEQLNLTSEWDKTFPKSDKVKHSKVTFPNRYGITLAADLYILEEATNPLTAIAAAHGKSVAQVILRWTLQRGVVVIPGSSNPEHMKENISVFDFELSEEEMARIAALNRNEKHDWY